jgi:DDE superfamily endonuclease
MEDILDLYAEPYDPQYPLVCFDESPYQLVSEVCQPLPVRPGQRRRYDDEYRREGTCNLFMVFEPLRGWRHVKVTDRRTAQDFAYCMKDVVDSHFPLAAVISVVLDNLNTHTPAALYATFPPDEACRILRKLDFHDTPKHGRWLNMAEIEFAVVSRQCLDRRLGDQRRSTARSRLGNHAATRKKLLLIGALPQQRRGAHSNGSTPYDQCGRPLQEVKPVGKTCKPFSGKGSAP